MSIIDGPIARFEPITLAQMDEVNLLNRFDQKFVFRSDQLPVIMDQLQEDYYVLETDSVRAQHYRTLYFDTPDYKLYYQHHNKHLNRYKVRNRKYMDSGRSFFEIKFKTNKGRTVKERKFHEGPQNEISGKSEKLLNTHTQLTPDMLIPALWVDFSRITLVSKGLTERVTIDTMLTFSGQSGRVSFPGIAVAEIKQERSASSHLSQILHRMHLRRMNMSKYCIGLCLLNPTIRHNNFKSKINYFNKINHDNHKASDHVPVAAFTGYAGESLPATANRS